LEQVIQTGKFFEAAAINKDNIGQAAKHLKLFLPGAQKRFHEALDELEIELVSHTSFNECATRKVNLY